MVEYDGSSWSDNVKFNNGDQLEKSDKYSIYGGYQYLHGTLYSGFSVRYAYRDDLYIHNNGLYLSAYKNNNWQNASGEQFILPIQNPDVLKVGEPCELGLGYRISGGTNWTVTENGAIHFLVSVSGNSVHYYKKENEKSFSHAAKSPYGELLSIGQNVFVIELIDGHITISSSPEGTNDWKVRYKDSSSREFRHFNVAQKGNKLFVYAMGNQRGEKQALYMTTFIIEK